MFLLLYSQVDVFKVSAIDLGKLKKLKVWHDNKGGGAAWFLDYIEVKVQLCIQSSSVRHEA